MTILKQIPRKYSLKWNGWKWLRIRFSGSSDTTNNMPHYCILRKQCCYFHAYFSHILNSLQINTLTDTHSPNYSTASNWCMYHWNCVSKFCFKYAVKKIFTQFQLWPSMALQVYYHGVFFTLSIFYFLDKRNIHWTLSQSSVLLIPSFYT